MNKDFEYKEGRRLLILVLRVFKPTMSDEEAENIIVNVGNWIQLERIKKISSAPKTLKEEGEGMKSFIKGIIKILIATVFLPFQFAYLFVELICAIGENRLVRHNGIMTKIMEW